MKKGVTGKVLTTMISMIVGIIALALLWLFLSKSTELIGEGVQRIISGIRCKILCYEIFGMDLGMCNGC